MINPVSRLLAATSPEHPLDPSQLPQPAATAPMVQTILHFFFGVAAATALVIIMIAAIRYIISRGEPDKIRVAKDTIIYALVGLVIALSGFAIVTFVFQRIIVK